MIAHVEFPQSWKKNKVGQCKKAGPCGYMGNNGYNLFVVLQVFYIKEGCVNMYDDLFG